jgi:hypothetical protein
MDAIDHRVRAFATSKLAKRRQMHMELSMVRAEKTVRLEPEE